MSVRRCTDPKLREREHAPSDRAAAALLQAHERGGRRAVGDLVRLIDAALALRCTSQKKRL
jgi:hypothetical protein